MSEQKLRILSVTAHPHDFTHSAATCGIHVARGDEVTVVSVGHGVYTHNEQLHNELMKPPEERDRSVVDQGPEAYSETKEQELREACSFFGIEDVRILGAEEPFRVARSPEIVDRLRDIILELRPHVMITQSPFFIGHHRLQSGAPDDHSEVAYASIEARNQAATVRYGSDEPPHHIAATYFPGVYFEKDQYDFYVDIAGWFERRVQAEMAFRSQGHTDDFARRRIAVTLGNIGWYAGVMYAESFVREKPEVLPRIIVADRSLERASEMPSEHIRRISGLGPLES